jgi:5-methylthioribose kinase
MSSKYTEGEWTLSTGSNKVVESNTPRWISEDGVAGIERFMRARGWLNAGERVMTFGPAGEGNMNVTLRVRTNRRSVILKQATPWVAKYPDIPAPQDRLLVEARFYRTVGNQPKVGGRMPRLVALDANAWALVLEDLAPAEDMTALYRGAAISDENCRQLGTYLAALHDTAISEPRKAFGNCEMRALNHTHMYRVPLEEPDVARLESLESGLGIAALKLAADDAFCTQVCKIGARYLLDGDCLVHGDFFPGSWLVRDDGVWLIDAEFSYLGDAEFDLGVALAHLALSRQEPFAAHILMDAYFSARRIGRRQVDLISFYAAAEVMRRLIGVAQLPIPPSHGWRTGALERSREAMLTKSWEKLW